LETNGITPEEHTKWQELVRFYQRYRKGELVGYSKVIALVFALDYNINKGIRFGKELGSALDIGQQCPESRAEPIPFVININVLTNGHKIISDVPYIRR